MSMYIPLEQDQSKHNYKNQEIQHLYNTIIQSTSHNQILSIFPVIFCLAICFSGPGSILGIGFSFHVSLISFNH